MAWHTGFKPGNFPSKFTLRSTTKHAL